MHFRRSLEWCRPGTWRLASLRNYLDHIISTWQVSVRLITNIDRGSLLSFSLTSMTEFLSSPQLVSQSVGPRVRPHPPISVVWIMDHVNILEDITCTKQPSIKPPGVEAESFPSSILHFLASGKHVVPQDTYPPSLCLALQHIIHVP